VEDRLFNREVGWIEFNSRVLEEGLDKSFPLLERLKFLSNVSTNLDDDVNGLNYGTARHVSP
jgi:polyphosphate kinase